MDRGYGNLRGKAFRIAHLGNIYQSDLISKENYPKHILATVNSKTFIL